MLIKKLKLLCICTKLFTLGLRLHWARRSLSRLIRRCPLCSPRAVRRSAHTEALSVRFSTLEKQVISLFLELCVRQLP